MWNIPKNIHNVGSFLVLFPNVAKEKEDRLVNSIGEDSRISGIWSAESPEGVVISSPLIKIKGETHIKEHQRGARVIALW